jgi:hypothetical protein
MNRKFNVWAGVAGAVLSVAGGVQLSSPSAASAVSGVHVEAGDGTANDSSPNKRDAAVCPPGEKVVGGGAWVDDFDVRQVRLTQLQPVRSGGRESFVAAAQEPNTGLSTPWNLRAYAVCAPSASVPGHQIVASAPASTSGAFVATAAGCPQGKKVIGTGATIATSQGAGLAGGQVGLQLNRSSGPLDISRATAREDADGFASSWTLTSYAICVTPVAGQHADSVVESDKVVGANCTSVNGQPTMVHGVGGGAGTTDSGLTWLQVVYPFSDLKGILVAMTGDSNVGAVATAVCAR